MATTQTVLKAEQKELGKVMLHVGDYSSVVFYRYPVGATNEQRRACAEKAVAMTLQNAYWTE